MTLDMWHPWRRALGNLLADTGIYQIEREARREDLQGREGAACQEGVRVVSPETPRRLSHVPQQWDGGGSGPWGRGIRPAPHEKLVSLPLFSRCCSPVEHAALTLLSSLKNVVVRGGMAP